MTSTTTFGFGMISAQHDPRDQRTDAELYADILDLCALAEDLGFDTAWLSEHHFVDDGYMPSLMVVAAAIAARTARMQIASGILVAPLHDPIRLAEDAATVDLLSAGRFMLGIGAGYRDEEFAGFGKSKERLGPVLDSVIETLRDAWSSRTAQGGPDAQPVVVTPKPHQPEGPPIWLGARTPAGIRRTARSANGLLAARVTPDELAAQVGLLTAELDKLGRPRSEVRVAVHCPVFAWPGEDAWDLIEPHLHYSEWKYKDMGAEPYGTRTARSEQPQLNDITRERLAVGALVGSPERVAESIAAYEAAVGDSPFQFIARLYWPGMDPSLQREAMSVYAEEVMPAVHRG